MAFFIDDKGNVTCDDGMEIGHIEDCLEEGAALMNLTELCRSVDLGVYK